MATSSLDRRRINPPETFAIPRRAPAQQSLEAARRTRTAGRTDVPPLFIQTGLVKHASGSAYLESDTIKVACAIYGPRASSSNAASGSSNAASGGGASASNAMHDEAEVNVDVRFANFATHRRKRAGKDVEAPELANAIRLALLPSIRLDKLPKATIDVHITILEANAGRGGSADEEGDELEDDRGDDDDDEACAAAATTAASCALADAGIELFGLVVGLHAVDFAAPGQTVVDATKDEARGAQGCVMAFSMPALGTVTSIEQSGRLTLDQVDRLLAVLQKAASQVHLLAAKAIQQGIAARQSQQS